jgi:hypothetical protein
MHNDCIDVQADANQTLGGRDLVSISDYHKRAKGAGVTATGNTDVNLAPSLQRNFLECRPQPRGCPHLKARREFLASLASPLRSITSNTP